MKDARKTCLLEAEIYVLESNYEVYVHARLDQNIHSPPYSLYIIQKCKIRKEEKHLELRREAQ